MACECLHCALHKALKKWGEAAADWGPKPKLGTALDGIAKLAADVVMWADDPDKAEVHFLHRVTVHVRNARADTIGEVAGNA